MDFYEKYKKFLIKQCSHFIKPFEEDPQKTPQKDTLEKDT